MTISKRQLYFFLACIAPVGKLVVMPTQLVYYAQNDLLLPTLFHLLLQAGIIFCIILLSRAQKTVFQLFENTLGKVGGGILSAILALFFFYAALFPLIEQKLFVQSVFYDTLPSFATFFPFFFFSAYLCAKPFSRVFRTFDLLAPISICGLLGLFVLAVGKADYSALLPVGGTGVQRIAEGTAFTSLWFYDSAIVLLFMGNFQYEKGMAVKCSLFYLLGGLLLLFFLATFYGVFADIAVRQSFAFAKISKYFSASSVLGRIDYIFILLLALVMAFYTCLPLQASRHCLSYTAQGKISPVLLSLILNAGAFVFVIAVNFVPNGVLKIIGEKLFWIFPVFCLLLPLILFLFRRSPREKAQ